MPIAYPSMTAKRSRRLLVLLFAFWLCAMMAALWHFESATLIFNIFCTAPNP
jgi:hypothetical protein